METLTRIQVFVEGLTEPEAELLLGRIAAAVCGPEHTEEQGHECSRDYAALAGMILNPGELPWQQMIDESFVGLFGGANVMDELAAEAEKE